MPRRFSLIVFIFAIGCMVSGLSAAVISFSTPSGATTGGQPVSAKATFTTSANQVVVFLENLQADPTSAVQCLSGLKFAISSGQTSATLASSSAVERLVNDNSASGYADLAATPVSTGWGWSTSGSSLWLDRLSQPNASKHTIIGPPNALDAYASANPSITGGSHNPHLGLNATFTLNVPGVTEASTITSTVFQFNTSYGNEVVPEPAVGAFSAAVLLGLARRRSARK